jgi:hypothetical protein
MLLRDLASGSASNNAIANFSGQGDALSVCSGGNKAKRKLLIR